MIVANNVDGDEMGGTLGKGTDVKIPVVSVTKASGARLRAEPGDTTTQDSMRAFGSSAPATSSRRRRPGPPPTW